MASKSREGLLELTERVALGSPSLPAVKERLPRLSGELGVSP